MSKRISPISNPFLVSLLFHGLVFSLILGLEGVKNEDEEQVPGEVIMVSFIESGDAVDMSPFTEEELISRMPDDSKRTRSQVIASTTTVLRVGQRDSISEMIPNIKEPSQNEGAADGIEKGLIKGATLEDREWEVERALTEAIDRKKKEQKSEQQTLGWGLGPQPGRPLLSGDEIGIKPTAHLQSHWSLSSQVRAEAQNKPTGPGVFSDEGEDRWLKSNVSKQFRLLNAGEIQSEDGKDETRNFLRKVKSRLERTKRYPWLARLRNQEGTARLSFIIKPSGEVGDIRLVQSSGWESLDHEALALVKRVGQFPSPPKTERGGDVHPGSIGFSA